MVEFKWIITDEFIDRNADEHYPADDFPYADGYFEMRLNKTRWGAYPIVPENWNHTFVRNFPPAGDCMTELFQCFAKVLHLQPSQTFVFQPMDKPLISLVFHRETDTLQINQERKEEEITEILLRKPGWSPPKRWSESVSFEEFCREVKDNFDQFLKVIGDENPAILDNIYIKELISEIGTGRLLYFLQCVLIQ